MEPSTRAAEAPTHAPPGAPRPRRRWRRIAAYGAVVAAVGAVYSIGIGRPIGNSDEAIYAEFIRGMQRSSDYGTLRYGEAVVYQRPTAPVAAYALTALVAPGEWGMRLLPTLLTFLTCVLVGLAAWWRARSLGAAIAALLLCAACPSVLFYGRLLSTDPPLLLASTLALGATMASQRGPRFIPWAAAALGAAFAAKSFAAAVTLVAVAPWLARAALRHRKEAGARRRLLLSVAAFLALAAPYYVVGLVAHGGAFVAGHFGANLAMRATGQIEGLGTGGALSYLEHLWAGDGPIVAVVLGASVVGALVVGLGRRDEDLAVPASYAALTLLVLSTIGFRTAHYLLPFYPGAALTAVLLWARPLSHIAERHALARLLAPIAAAVLFCVTLLAPYEDDVYAPSRELVEVARLAAVETSPDERVFSWNWYAPALGYYADRRWQLLTSSVRGERILLGVDVLRASGAVRRVPPVPEGRLVIAVPRPLLAAAEVSLSPLRPIASTRNLVLVEREGTAPASAP